VRLRPGLRFHSGNPCDAPAVLAALETLRWGGGGDHQVGYWDPVDTVTADGADTLVFRLHYPYVRLPSLLWGTHTAISGEAVRARGGAAFGRTAVDGTGPFRCVEWSPSRILAERWEDYPGAPSSLFAQHGPARLQAIEWLSIPDEQERLDALESGRVHCLHGPILSEVARLRADPRFAVVEYPQCSNVYLGLNWDRPELGFADLRVRRAVSMAIDRAAIVEQALAGHGTVAHGPIGPGEPY
jgi:peptide/nickel transport system substrate-binding protein